MATLRYSQIRAHPGGTIRYIANKDKLISEPVRDVGVVLNYMGEPESVERVFSFARHCSTNPVLAEKQIELDRARYFASKKGGVQGLKEDSNELLGLHFFMSYTVEDNPSERTMNEIAMKIAKHPLMEDFAVFGANHFDKNHRHTHFFVSSYSASGKPRKLGMKKEGFNEIRRYANKLCVECGLSIIDLERLRYNNAEYSDWIDRVIEEGKVIVHPEKEERKKWNNQKIPTRQLYYKHMREDEERTQEEYRLMTEIQRQKKAFENKYYYTPDGDVNRRWYVSGDPKQRFYTVSLVDKKGYRYTKLELVVRFVMFVADCEGRYIRETDAATWLKYNAKVESRLQGMYDYVTTATKMSIKRPEEIPSKIADVGRQMNALKREKLRHENSIEIQERMIEAYKTYTYARPLTEGVQEPDTEALRAYNEAYAILARNQILSAEAYAGLCRRYEFEKQKVIDYDNRMPLLKKQYHELKKLEALASRPRDILNIIYGYSALANERRTVRGINEILSDAQIRASRNDRGKGREKSY